jgi:hypothetical protein
MKLLWLSDSPTRATGFGTVGRHLLRRLAATGQYQILALGRDYDPATQDPALHPYPLCKRSASSGQRSLNSPQRSAVSNQPGVRNLTADR